MCIHDIIIIAAKCSTPWSHGVILKAKLCITKRYLELETSILCQHMKFPQNQSKGASLNHNIVFINPLNSFVTVVLFLATTDITIINIDLATCTLDKVPYHILL